jgi:uncharacterized protein
LVEPDWKALKLRLKSDGEVRLEVKAIPKSSRDEVAGVMDDGVLRVRVTAAPEKGKANDAICELLARMLDVAPSKVRVARGAASARKQIVVTR